MCLHIIRIIHYQPIIFDTTDFVAVVIVSFIFFLFFYIEVFLLHQIGTSTGFKCPWMALLKVATSSEHNLKSRYPESSYDFSALRPHTKKELPSLMYESGVGSVGQTDIGIRFYVRFCSRQSSVRPQNHKLFESNLRNGSSVGWVKTPRITALPKWLSVKDKNRTQCRGSRTFSDTCRKRITNDPEVDPANPAR